MVYKYLAVILLTSAWAGAADFVTGQAARAVFGQQTFTAQDIETPCQGSNSYNCANPGPYVLGAAGGVAFANDTVFVADSSRINASPVLNRIVMYTGISTFLRPPDQPVPNYSAHGFVRCPLCIGTTLVDLNTIVLGGYPAVSSLPGGVFPDYVGYGITAKSFRTPTALAT